MTPDYLEIYKQRLNLKDAHFSLIEHGDAIVAIVYKVQTKDGVDLILKICEQAGHYNKELYFLNHFANTLLTPKVIAAVQPTVEVHGAILMQCLPGDLLRAANITQTLAFEIGALWAKIHLHKTSAYGDLTASGSLIPDPIAYFTDKFMESFDECKGHLPTELLHKCQQFFERNITNIKSVDGPCIIHRDFRPGNIIVHNGRVSGIIDWASARSGFAEDDLCPIEIGEWGDNAVNRQSLLDGYATIRTVPDYSVVLPLLCLNRAIAVLGFTIKIGSWDKRDAAFYKRNLAVMQQILD